MSQTGKTELDDGFNEPPRGAPRNADVEPDDDDSTDRKRTVTRTCRQSEKDPSKEGKIFADYKLTNLKR